MTSTHPSKRSGFTLIEIMLVIMILGIIAIVSMNNLDIAGRSDQARRTATESLIGQMTTAVNSYYLDIGRMPSSLEALTNDPGVRDWKGPYLMQIRQDPWGDPFSYTTTGNRFEITSTAGNTDGGPISSNDL
jgi:general secretion pathway protein G